MGMNKQTEGARDICLRLLEHSESVTESGCRIWLGNTNALGYGRIGIAYKVELAHRVAFEAWIGPIPSGACVLHSCDVPSCINPAHLWLGDRDLNNKDMARKMRARHKLNPEQVHEARMSTESCLVLAKRFGVDENAIRLLRKRLTYRWVE